jgi:hypothetical protein
MLGFKLAIGAMAGAAVVLGASPALAAGGWTIVPAPPTGQNAVLAGVTAPSDTNAWAVGYSNAAANGLGAKMVIDHWNGSAWSQVTAPAITGSADLLATSSSGTSDAWAVGYSRVQRYTFYPLAIHWNGSAWSISSPTSVLPTDTILYGVTDISSTDAYAFGDNSALASGELAHWNGTSWSQVAYPLPTNTGYDQTLNAISADGPNDVWAIGEYLDQIGSNLRWETFALHWNGAAWKDVTMPLVSGSDAELVYQINSMDAISPTNVWAAGGSGDNASPYGGTPSKTLIEHWNGSAWSVASSPNTGTNDNLTGVTETSPTSLTAVGYATPSGASGAQTLTMTWNGTSWAIGPSPNDGTPSVLTSVSTAPGDAVVQAVGYDGAEGSWNPLAMQSG